MQQEANGLAASRTPEGVKVMAKLEVVRPPGPLPSPDIFSRVEKPSGGLDSPKRPCLLGAGPLLPGEGFFFPMVVAGCRRRPLSRHGAGVLRQLLYGEILTDTSFCASPLKLACGEPC